MTAPLAPIRRRTSWTVEHEAAVAGVTVVPLPEPMPETAEELSIAKAIEKLEGLRGRRNEPWKLLGGNEWISPIGITVAPDDGGVSPKEAELIVTLHRTIDAQLAILRAYQYEIALPRREGTRLDAAARGLATAILGSNQ